MEAPPLTFAALDGLAFAAARNRLGALAAETVYAGGALGPFLEFSQLVAAGLLPRPGDASWFLPGAMQAFETALCSGRKQWICPNGASSGFFRMGAQWSEDDTPWMGFQLATQKAAGAMGFHRRTAAQFAAALGEMFSNVHEHSGAPSSASPPSRAAATRSSLPSPTPASVCEPASVPAPSLLTSPTTVRPCALR